MPFYTLLGHIGCQSEFDELVLMSSRPVDRGSCRMEETKVPFHPGKGSFGRMGSVSAEFRPPKGRFARMGTLRNRVARILCKQISDLAADLTPKIVFICGTK